MVPNMLLIMYAPKIQISWVCLPNVNSASHCVLTRFVYGAQFAFHQIINRQMFVCILCVFVYLFVCSLCILVYTVCSTLKCKQNKKRAASLIQMKWTHHDAAFIKCITCCSHSADLPLTEKCLYSLDFFFILV